MPRKGCPFPALRVQQERKTILRGTACWGKASSRSWESTLASQWLQCEAKSVFSHRIKHFLFFLLKMFLNTSGPPIYCYKYQKAVTEEQRNATGSMAQWSCTSLRSWLHFWLIQSLSEGIYPFCSLSSALLLVLSEWRWGPAGIGLNSASKLQVLSSGPSVSPVLCPSEAILTPLQEQIDLTWALAGAWLVPCFPCRINLLDGARSRLSEVSTVQEVCSW